MFTVVIRQPTDLGEFRETARRLLAANAQPDDVAWFDQEQNLFAESLPAAERIINVPRCFVELADSVVCHRDTQAWPLLYQALWRIGHGEQMLLDRHADPLTHRLQRMAAEVRRDQHRMTAFLRFRTVPGIDDEMFVAWYEPRHRILRKTSTFFIDRFASMRFAILTPDLTMHWDRTEALFSAGLVRKDAPANDATEDTWRRYYNSIFNPARVNPRLMRSHMPRQFWQDLPETKDIPRLIADAGERTKRMIEPPASRR